VWAWGLLVSQAEERVQVGALDVASGLLASLVSPVQAKASLAVELAQVVEQVQASLGVGEWAQVEARVEASLAVELAPVVEQVQASLEFGGWARVEASLVSLEEAKVSLAEELAQVVVVEQVQVEVVELAQVVVVEQVQVGALVPVEVEELVLELAAVAFEEVGAQKLIWHMQRCLCTSRTKRSKWSSRHNSEISMHSRISTWSLLRFHQRRHQ
jgi:hypothetical protein